MTGHVLLVVTAGDEGAGFHSLDLFGIDGQILSFNFSSILLHVYLWDMLSFSLILHSSTSI